MVIASATSFPSQVPARHAASLEKNPRCRTRHRGFLLVPRRVLIASRTHPLDVQYPEGGDLKPKIGNGQESTLRG
jgi:hypothetical protein